MKAERRTILLLYRSLSLGILPLVVIGVVALRRWRAMVPFLYLVLLAELAVRRLVALMNPAARTDATLVDGPISRYSRVF